MIIRDTEIVNSPRRRCKRPEESTAFTSPFSRKREKKREREKKKRGRERERRGKSAAGFGFWV